jgi:colanic acid/amylovoran biosynthesis protein
MNAFFEALLGADLVVASGGGYITDAFAGHAIGILSVLEKAMQLGKPTAMLGQGLGPVQSKKLLNKATSILPSVHLIALRESRAGLPFLDSLGVARDRVVTTGDDAIELAYEAHAPELGNGIGVNLRVSPYSKVDRTLIKKVRAVLQNVAGKYNVPMIPLPISLVDVESDARTIRELLAGYADVSDREQSPDTPCKVLREVSRCRLVVTGSYHAGVFALAQGIPVVGLASSSYYVYKFLGLADQFGTGVQSVFLGDEQLHEKLMTAIDLAWRSAGQIRPQLLEAARQQIEFSRLAYQRLYAAVISHEAVA